jgi:hypothetical protein
MQIHMQPSTIQKNDLSVIDYFIRVKCLANTLVAIRRLLEDEELIAYLVRGLSSDYDPLITSITTRMDILLVTYTRT